MTGTSAGPQLLSEAEVSPEGSTGSGKSGLPCPFSPLPLRVRLARPTEVLPRHADDQMAGRRVEARPPDIAFPPESPLPPHQLSVPAEQDLGPHDEGGPQPSREPPARRSEQDSVESSELRTLHLPA